MGIERTRFFGSRILCKGILSRGFCWRDLLEGSAGV